MFRTPALLLTLVVAACGDSPTRIHLYGPPAADPSTYLFETDAIHDFYLDIPPDSWTAIDSEAWVLADRSYYDGTLRFEAQTFMDAGIRTKGGLGSTRDLSGKAAFKVNLGWDDPSVAGCPPSRRLHGVKSLTFNNAVQDSSFMHERLGYALYQAMHVPTPRAAHVRLYVNDEYWGLYVLVETINRQFLKRWFDSNDGMLYEVIYRCDLVDSAVIPEPSGCFSREFTSTACDTPSPGADRTTYELLIELVRQLDDLAPGGFYPEVNAFFDFDNFLAASATRLALMRMPSAWHRPRRCSKAWTWAAEPKPCTRQSRPTSTPIHVRKSATPTSRPRTRRCSSG